MENPASENQSIERRYLDRQLMIALLDRLFQGNYLVDVRPHSLELRSVPLIYDKNSGAAIQDRIDDSEEAYQGRY